MRLLLDSSYFLTYFRVLVEGISYNFLKQLMERKDLELLISEITYSELVAKIFKLAKSDSKWQYEDILSGIDSLRNESRIELIPWYNNPKILEIALEIRKMHNDFFDCIIFASSIVEADAIGTYDDSLFKKIRNDKMICKLIKETNPEFKFWFNDFKTSPKTLISKI